MEYSIVEGKILNSKNYECQGYWYVKVRESPNSIFLNCALFRTHSCESFGKIDKLTDLFEVTNLHNHSVESHNKEKIILSNQIKRKAETTTCELKEIFNECCRDSIGASSVTFKKLESSMFKRRRKIQPRLPSCAQEFGVLLLESGYSTNHLKTVIQEDDVALNFGSDSMVNKLLDFTHIQFDGTFKLIPRLFLQLFTIFVEFNGHTLPALHILMTRKTEQLYTAVFFYSRIIPCLIPVFEF